MRKRVRIPSNLDYVKNPDHPFVDQGPNYVITDGEGNLICLFFPEVKENGDISKLYLRLLNSRLVYPPKALMILVLDKNTSDYSSQSIEDNYFNKVIYTEDMSKVSLLMKEKFDQNSQYDLGKVQYFIFNNQAKMQMNNVSYIKRTNFNSSRLDKFPTKFKKAKYYNSFKKTEEQSTAPIYEVGDDIVGVIKMPRYKSDINHMRPFYEFTMKSVFRFDNHVPYGKVDTFTRVLNLNKIPTIKTDPLKPIRIASLFGWLICNVNSIDQIEKRKTEKYEE